MEPTLLPIQTMLLLLLLFGVAVLLIADAADHADAVVLVVVDLSVLWSICSYPRWIVTIPGIHQPQLPSSKNLGHYRYDTVKRVGG